MGEGGEKLLLLLGGIPLIARALIPFQSCSEIGEIVVVANPVLGKRLRDEVLKPEKIDKVVRIVPGGPRRQDSVYNGLCALSARAGTVLIHDGDRPFVTEKLIRAVLAAAAAGGALAAVRAKDTVKLTGEGMTVEATLPRKRLWLAQTPQGFPRGAILAGHERARSEGWDVTDDAEVVERCGGRVTIVESEYDNIKVATPEDYDLACLIQSRLSRSSG